MANRCTPYQKLKAARDKAAAAQPKPTVRVVERTRNVQSFSHTFDSLDAGDRRLVWSLKFPVKGVVLEPKVSCGACKGEVVLDAVFNGVIAVTMPLKENVQEIGKGPLAVNKGDIVDIYVHGSGSAKEVAISLVLREG